MYLISLLLLNAGGHRSFLFESQKGKYLDTQRDENYVHFVVMKNTFPARDHVRAVDVGRNEETCIVMQMRSSPVINSTTLRNYGRF